MVDTTKELSVSEMEAILLADPHVKGILQDPEIEVPELNTQLWSKKDEDVEVIYNSVREVLNFPFILDNFKSHPERKDWRYDLNRKYDAMHCLLNSNALRRGKILHISALAHTLKENSYIGTNPDKFYELVEELANIIDKKYYNYDDYTTIEKIQYVRKVRQKAVEFMNFLSEQTPASP